VKIGVLGCASVAERLMIPAINASGVFKLAAIASRDLTKAESFAKRFGGEPLGSYEALIGKAGIDAVYIPLPTGLHAEWAAKALAAGKHVLIEKSLASNLTEVTDLVALAKKNKLALWENFMFEHHSQMQFIHSKITDGAIGELRCVRASFGFPPFSDKNNIRYKKSLGGGALLDAGAYTVKISQLILGMELEVKAANLMYDDELGVDIFGGAFLSNQRGLFSEVAFGFDHFYQCNLELWGSLGKLTAERVFTAAPGFQPKVVLEKQNERYELTLPADNHFVEILKVFHEAIVSNQFETNYDKLISQAKIIQNIFDYADRK
jgi:dTDP-3,4-didehydro-2,6-dideoxy-alpha-D-glucose 3-reductase